MWLEPVPERAQDYTQKPPKHAHAKRGCDTKADDKVHRRGNFVKEFGFAVRSGIEQRDAAIKMGAAGATTLLFRDEKFVMPASSRDSLKKEPHVRRMMVEKLVPEEGDLVIIGSAKNEKTAELGAKSAALLTIFSHEKHH